MEIAFVAIGLVTDVTLSHMNVCQLLIGCSIRGSHPVGSR